MGLKKWLGLDFSASQPAGHRAKDDEADERQPQIQRRHTTWEMQTRTPTYAPTHQAVNFERRPDSYQQHDHRFSSTVHNDTSASKMLTPPPQYESDSDVSLGADDDFVPAPELALRSNTKTAILTEKTSEHTDISNVNRFSWINVLGRSSDSDQGQNALMKVTNKDEAARLRDNKATCSMVPNPDIALRPEDEGMGVVIQGWLEKCGQHFKTWKWRFFVLRNDGVLSYFTDETGKVLKGSLDLGYGSKAEVSVQSNSMDKNFVFVISTPQRNLMISAPSQHMMAKWIALLHRAGALPTQPWDPLRKTVKFFVNDTVCNHEWKRFDDPTSYIHMEGRLLKRGHLNKNWKTRFFRIQQGELRYYTENQNKCKGSVPLKDTIVSPGMAQCPDGRKYYFVLTSKDSKFEMHLNAHNEKSMHLWIEALQEAQTALSKVAGNKETVAGLSLVIKRAEQIPLGKIKVLYKRAEDIDIEMDKRTEALIVVSSPQKRGIAVGSQLISVEGRSILRETYKKARKILRASSFPLQLEFLLPPYKRGVLIKKSRSGFENWKRRVVVVTNGEIHYYKQASSFTGGKKSSAELKHCKSFSLSGCYLNLIKIPDRDLCIVVARSPSDKLVLQTRTEEERMEWASVIYCSIRMVSQGVTAGHIENLNLEQTRFACKRMPL
ncbi:pleckstrin-like domain-containing protein [Plasmopara halstedii]|uniref:Pleckstrin-like domain-containing protein n=1 Tax=Plasmopara halstedii TaxID=4781 RepID=A0A0N7L4P1_PLAHL|nr:pleckstrin-like domain-containing protein [Plasmopara halstedii]CEG39219.1 pleckstrin-like domain-containing protein [Plasmopara halstedii]|eukprot:XP_024575588.1 pleckstrin-like domain-containing protein [Plasmopara halstedii]